jgi:hypothetical protein
LIPDDLAYRHFLMAVAEHTNASGEEIRRRESRLLPLRFSKQDHDFFISALETVREKLDEIDSDRSTLNNAASESALETLKRQEDSALTGAAERVRSALTPAGLASLDEYIRETVKRQIVIYGY